MLHDVSKPFLNSICDVSAMIYFIENFRKRPRSLKTFSLLQTEIKLEYTRIDPKINA